MDLVEAALWTDFVYQQYLLAQAFRGAHQDITRMTDYRVLHFFSALSESLVVLKLFTAKEPGNLGRVPSNNSGEIAI